MQRLLSLVRGTQPVAEATVATPVPAAPVHASRTPELECAAVQREGAHEESLGAQDPVIPRSPLRPPAETVPNPIRHSPRRPAIADGAALAADAAVGADTAQVTVSAASPVSRQVKLRTPENARKGQPSFSLPPGMPPGPWKSDAEAKKALEDHARNSADGRYALCWTNLRPGCGTRGQQHTLSCHRHTADKCKFQLVLELTTEGVIIQRAALEHSHSLARSLAEANAQAALRHIPEELIELARTCSGAGLSPAKVNVLLAERARELRLEVSWNYQDVYRLLGASAAEKSLDACGMLELLMDRRQLLGLPFSVMSGEDGRLERALFVLEGGQQLYAQQVACKRTITLFDLTVRAFSNC
jgi:hypothetical protein